MSIQFTAMASGSSLIGSPQELLQFTSVFGGMLAVALALGLGYHKTRGLPLPLTPAFDWTLLLLGLWFYSGMAIDGWAHKHGAVDESFFTIWHAVFYSGFVAYASFIKFTLYRLHEGALSFTLSGLKSYLSGMPAGYGMSILGMGVFAIAGGVDMLWHTFLGIEGGTDALLSPSHLGLAAGMSLAVMAPFWSAWHVSDSGRNGLISQLPMLAGLGAAWSVLTLFTSYTHHLTAGFSEICGITLNCDNGTAGLEFGMAAIILQSAMLVAAVLLFNRRWRPAKGSFSVLLAVNGLSIAAFAPGEVGAAWKHLVVPLLTGVILDILFQSMPRLQRSGSRLFAFLIPSIHTAVWLLALSLFNGEWGGAVYQGDLLLYPLGWTVHSTTGAVFVAGAVGVLISIVMLPPALPTNPEQSRQSD